MTTGTMRAKVYTLAATVLRALGENAEHGNHAFAALDRVMSVAIVAADQNDIGRHDATVWLEREASLEVDYAGGVSGMAAHTILWPGAGGAEAMFSAGVAATGSRAHIMAIARAYLALAEHG